MASENGNGSVAVLEPSAAPASAVIDHAEVDPSTLDGIEIPDADELAEVEAVESEPEGDEESTDTQGLIDAGGDKGINLEMTNAETIVGNLKNKAKWLAWRANGEKLFGHTEKPMRYVDFIYDTHDLLVLEQKLAESKGEKFVRADFKKTAKDLLTYTTAIPTSQIDVSRWLQCRGVMELARAKTVEGVDVPICPNAKPPVEFMSGNLTYTTLKAIAPLVKVDAGSGGDQYSWIPGCASVGLEMVRQLRAGSLPCSYQYVEKERARRQGKAEEALKKSQRAALSPNAAAAAERAELDALDKSRQAEIDRMVEKIRDRGAELNFSPEELRGKLIRKGAINPVAKEDFGKIMEDPLSRDPLVQAVVNNPECRVMLIQQLAKVITHQDVNNLVAAMHDNFKKTSSPVTRAALVALKNTFTPKEGAAKS